MKKIITYIYCFSFSIILLLFVIGSCNSLKLVEINNYQELFEYKPVSHVFNLNIDTIKKVINNKFIIYNFARGFDVKNMKGRAFIDVETYYYLNKDYLHFNSFYYSSGRNAISPSDIYYSKRTKKPYDYVAEFSIDLKKLSDTTTKVIITTHNSAIITVYRFPLPDIEWNFYSRPKYVNVKSSPNDQLEFLSSLAKVLGDSVSYTPIKVPKIYVSRNGKRFYTSSLNKKKE